MKSRRSSFVMWEVMSCLLRGTVHRAANPIVGAATADVARHGLIDVLVRRILLRGDERRGAHDLSGLTIAALRHALGDPRPLDGVRGVRRQTLDRRDGARAH